MARAKARDMVRAVPNVRAIARAKALLKLSKGKIKSRGKKGSTISSCYMHPHLPPLAISRSKGSCSVSD